MDYLVMITGQKLNRPYYKSEVGTTGIAFRVAFFSK